MPSILNAVGNATTGLATIAGVAQGSILAQPSTSILGVNIPGIPLVSFRDYFLASMESWVTALPLRTQYIALIDRYPPGINTSLIQSLEPINGDKKNFDVSKAKRILGSYPMNGVVGCIFLQGMQIPAESLNAGVAQIQNNKGFIQGSLLNGREAFASNQLTLQFRETNLSFVDFVIRPWLLLASHAGYVARPSNDPKYCKANITLIQYTRSYQKVSQIPRKIWQFYNCVPLSLSNRDLSYDTEQMDAYNVNFTYDGYGIQNNLYIPLPDIIDRLSNGLIPRISPLQK